MPDHPPIQIVDDQDRPVGEASLQEALSQGLAHRVVLVIVEDDAGKILLQKRGSNVATNADKWDFSAAGYVNAGETYSFAASRELEEELGLKDFDLQEIETDRSSETHGDFVTDRFTTTYKVVIPVRTPLKLEASEVSAVQWFNRQELQTLLRDQAASITLYTADWLQAHYFGHENNVN